MVTEGELQLPFPAQAHSSLKLLTSPTREAGPGASLRDCGMMSSPGNPPGESQVWHQGELTLEAPGGPSQPRGPGSLVLPGQRGRGAGRAEGTAPQSPRPVLLCKLERAAPRRFLKGPGLWGEWFSHLSHPPDEVNTATSESRAHVLGAGFLPPQPPPQPTWPVAGACRGQLTVLPGRKGF